jgi:hypothetical protein
MAVTVSFAMTRADLLRLSWVALRNRPFILALSVGFFIVLPWAIAVWEVVEVARGEANAPILSIVVLFLIPPLAVVGFGAIPLWLLRGSRVIGARHKFEFTEEDIHLTGPATDSRIQWSAFTKCYGTKHGVVFYSGDLPTIFIPRRALTLEEAAELRAMSSTRAIEVIGPWARAGRGMGTGNA